MVAPTAKRHVYTSAYEMFSLGFDTRWIEAYFGISEAEALRRINVERSAAKGLPNPYQQS